VDGIANYSSDIEEPQLGTQPGSTARLDGLGLHF
jgi:hypothetical protein